MAYYSIENSKLSNYDKQLFDIKTVSTAYGNDISINSANNFDRVVGLDKLQQQIRKVLLVRKNSYDNKLGVTYAANSKNTVNVDIQESLTTYAKLQQQSQTSIQFLGRNVYRTADISNSNSWRKLNKQVISSNVYIDDSLTVGSFYYYSVSSIYKDSLGKITETKIETYESAAISDLNTLDAEVNDSFILINGNKKTLIYWWQPVVLNLEEQLRSIISIVVSPFVTDPRQLVVNVKVTNRELTQAQIDAISK